MQKRFIEWAHEKESIEKNNNPNIFCKRGEVWIGKIGVNIGNEVSKESSFLRPLLILENKIDGDLILVAPLTSQWNENFKNFLIELKHQKIKKKSYVQLNQIRVISKKRLVRDVCVKLPASHLNSIKKQLQEQVLKPRLDKH